jgi:CubicO group peptidase (beta-lactamase class C family)
VQKMQGKTMQTGVKWLRRVLAGLVVLMALAAMWIWIAPPAMLRVATGYAAKMVCSYTFLAGRDAQLSMQEDVREQGHPIMRSVGVQADAQERTVTARVLGFAATSVAVARAGTGCALAIDEDVNQAKTHAAVVPAATAQSKLNELWPQGDSVALLAPVQNLLEDTALTGPGMRAVVVIKDGRIVAETYGKGFDTRTPVLGWSMTKTVTAGLVGTLVRDGKLQLDQSALFPQWKDDERRNITLAHLMAMSSGLRFNEDYGAVTDITRMLYLERDTAAFAASQPLDHPPGSFFSYSSGTTVLLSRLWQNAVGDRQQALDYPQRALFGPLGMQTAILEADARGTFVGSSYLFASGRDWARYAQLLLQDGVWNGQTILPPGFVKMMHTAAPASMAPYGRREYGQGQLWLRGSPSGTPKGQDPDAGFALPSDIYWFSGYDGQAIAVIPSLQLALVRLGITPSKLGFKLQPLVMAAVKATSQ